MPAPRLRYTSDPTDDEGEILAPLLPPEKSGGRPRKSAMREVLNGMQYVRRAGGAWRLMPHDLPHGQPASQYFRAWRRDGTWRRIHDQLRAAVRTRMGRHPQPSGASLDAQTVKPTENGGRMAMTGPSNSMAARAIPSWRRRVSSGVSAPIPPS